MNTLGGRALNGLGVFTPDYQTLSNSEYREVLCWQTHGMGANVRRGKGNNPDHQSKVP